jgi:hypothetical protein
VKCPLKTEHALYAPIRRRGPFTAEAIDEGVNAGELGKLFEEFYVPTSERCSSKPQTYSHHVLPSACGDGLHCGV